MKYKKPEIIFLLIFISFISLKFAFPLKEAKEETVVISKEEIMKMKEDSINQNKFNKIKTYFGVYNTNIQDTIVVGFLEVCNFFGFSSDSNVFNECIAQICYESRARQYKDNGKLVRGFSGEVGLSQIMPSTAHWELCQMKKEDLEYFVNNMQMSYPTFLDKRFSKSKKEVIDWLGGFKNNFILWGYIMNKNYVKTKNFHNTLHIYNAGMGNYLKWQKKGKNSSVFKYVKKIKKIKNKLIII